MENAFKLTLNLQTHYHLGLLKKGKKLKLNQTLSLIFFIPFQDCITCKSIQLEEVVLLYAQTNFLNAGAALVITIQPPITHNTSNLSPKTWTQIQSHHLCNIMGKTLVKMNYKSGLQISLKPRSEHWSQQPISIHMFTMVREKFT